MHGVSAWYYGLPAGSQVRRACENTGKFVQCMQELDIPRSSLVVSTKIFWGGKGVNDRGLSRKVGPGCLGFRPPSLKSMAIAYTA